MQIISSHLQERVMTALRQEVYAGFALDPHLLVDDFLGLFTEEELSVRDLRQFIQGGLQDILLEYQAEQKHWPPRTDCDRLDDAFEELIALGIVACHHFWCTHAVALSMIGDEIATHEAATTAGHARGYVYYCEQDTWLAQQGAGLYLHFGGLEGTPENRDQISSDILRAFARQGLSADFAGADHDLIHLDLTWQRRRAA